MSFLIYTAITLSAYIGMEFMAWFAHKYVMHGFLWGWHEDHHKKELIHGFFHKNDRFFLVFAVPSATCYILGSAVPGLFGLFFVGVGISLYGLTYFLIHDVYIHRRFKWFNLIDNFYSRAVLRAHGAHHAKREKEDGESFGLLVINPKYFKPRSQWKKQVDEEYGQY